MIDITIALPESYTLPSGFRHGSHWNGPGQSGWYLIREQDGAAIRVEARPDLVEVEDEDEVEEGDGSAITADEIEEKIKTAFVENDAAQIAATEAVILETMPGWMRASHEAAGGTGAYPANGATRYIVGREAAEAIVAADEWARIVRPAKATDFPHYTMDISGEQAEAEA